MFSAATTPVDNSAGSFPQGRHDRRRSYAAALRVCRLLALLTTAGCQFSPFRDNLAMPPGLQPLTQETPADEPIVRADDAVGERESGDRVLVGLCLSGGGSRAAVFGGEVMLELDRLGVLDRVDYVSAVSGGSIPAAYWCLSRDPGDARPDRPVWTPAAVRTAMTADFPARVRLWLLSPVSWLKYFWTGYNRSCVFADAMDGMMFRGARMGDLNPRRAKLLINTTALKDGRRVTLTDRELRRMGIRPSSLRLADAVQTSNAFPGVFHPRAFPVFSGGDVGPEIIGYRHLVDGGVNENGGVFAVLDVYDANRDRFPGGCVLIMINSGRPLLSPPGTDETADLRRGLDYLIDLPSASQAIDVILEANRLYVNGILESRARSDNVRVIELSYTEGVLLGRDDMRRRNGNGRPAGGGIGFLTEERQASQWVDVMAPLRSLMDLKGILMEDQLAPTTLSIDPDAAEAVRRAARREVMSKIGGFELERLVR